MNEKQELREFWEWCGFKIQPLRGEEYLGNFYYYPDSNRIERHIDLTLDNLFKYGITQAIKKLGLLSVRLAILHDCVRCEIWYDWKGYEWNKDILAFSGKKKQSIDEACTQALYQALNKVRRGE